MMPTTQPFSKLLSEHLHERQARNARYSMRAMAQHLETSSSSLSQVIRGQRRLSEKMISQYADRLGFDRAQIQELAQPQTKTPKRVAQKQMPPEAVRLFENGLLLEMLEMTKLRDFEPSPQWYAKRLSISVPTAQRNIQLLEKHGYLDTKTKVWRDLLGASSSIAKGELTSGSLRKYQCQLLRRSGQAVQETPLERRSHTSVVINVSPHELPVIKKKIQTFRRHLINYLGKNAAARGDVYALQIALFPLTTNLEAGDNDV